MAQIKGAPSASNWQITKGYVMFVTGALIGGLVGMVVGVVIGAGAMFFVVKGGVKDIKDNT